MHDTPFRRSLASRAACMLPVFAALTVLAACQDPSGAGLGLIDEQGVSPNAQIVEASATSEVPTEVRTGGFAAIGSAQEQSRVLVGRASDALLGNVEAVGYVDIGAPTAALPAEFASRPLLTAQLRLARNYIYGDTTATLPIEVREINQQWTPVGLPADTTLSTGPLLASVSRLAREAVYTVDLPLSWVTERDSVLRSADSSTLFEGFQLLVPAGAPAGAVAGFGAAGSVLRVTTDQDTVDYALNELYTAVRRSPPALAAPAGLYFLRGSSPSALSFSFNFASLQGLPLARGVLRFSLDRTSVAGVGPFVRPIATRARVTGIRADGTRVPLTDVNVQATGDASSATGAAAVSVLPFTNVLQGILLGREGFDRFELGLLPSPISLDVLPIVVQPRPDAAPPRLVLTVVGQPL